MSLNQRVRQGLVDLEILNCTISSLPKPPEGIELDADNLEFVSFLDDQLDQSELDLPLMILEIKHRMGFPKDYLALEKHSKMHSAIAAYQQAVKPHINTEIFDKQAINSAIRGVRALVEQCFCDYNKLTKQYLLIHAHKELPAQHSTKPLLRMAKPETVNLLVKDSSVKTDRILYSKKT